ncbi:MAG: hypothetical protein KBC48_01645 [Candidatus Pacebacteria bacterium]|nr:hypothetical protein [Candidatus Paceibacterota bacterium]
MSSDNNVFERLFKLWASICKLILDGKRDAGKIADVLQGIISEGVGDQYGLQSFSQTREGIWESDDFQALVVSKIAPNTSCQPIPLKSFTLERQMADSEIEKKLSEHHLFLEGDLCITIAKLIQEQRDGKEGQLAVNGKSNLFYVGSYVVCVNWNIDDRKWYVIILDRVCSQGRAGDRVFSPAIDAA